MKLRQRKSWPPRRVQFVNEHGGQGQDCARREGRPNHAANDSRNPRRTAVAMSGAITASRLGEEGHPASERIWRSCRSRRGHRRGRSPRRSDAWAAHMASMPKHLLGVLEDAPAICKAPLAPMLTWSSWPLLLSALSALAGVHSSLAVRHKARSGRIAESQARH